MKVEVWGDVACSWTRLGVKRMENAIAQFSHADEVELVWRSYELYANAPREAPDDWIAQQPPDPAVPTPDRRQAHGPEFVEVAAREGLVYHLDRVRFGNTFDAHRLIHLAKACGLERAVRERLMNGYFADGEPIGDRETLVKLAAEAGLDANEARATLESDAYAAEVLADETVAKTLGIGNVPFFVINDKYGIRGAQMTRNLLEALEVVWEESHQTDDEDGDELLAPLS